MKKILMSAFMLAASHGGVAHASEYGCKVLLCLANPASNGGPKGVSECVSPINQLYDDLAHGRGFPSCDLADGNDGTSYARQTMNYFDPCPDRTKAATPGTGVVLGTPKTITQGGRNYPSYQTTGTSAISESQYTNDYGNTTMGPQACVGNLIGSYINGNQNSSYTQYGVYDKVIWQQPQSPRSIDVYIDNKLQQRVHW